MRLRCTIENGVFVARLSGLLRKDDVRDLAVAVEAYVADPACPGLFLVDSAGLKVISPDGADALLALMKADADRIVRSAVVVGEGTSALQLWRLIRDAASEKRRMFTSESIALAWLKAR
jgi:hypothetical protein